MLRKAGAAALVVAGVSVFWAADLPQLRFSSVPLNEFCTPALSAEQMLELPPRVDVVAIGSSRILFGVAAARLAGDLGPDYAQSFNLGRPGSSFRRSEAIVDYLLSTGRNPKVVILEADLDMIRLRPYGGRRIPVPEAGYLTYAQILHSANVDLGVPFSVYTAIKAKLSTVITAVLTGEAFKATARTDGPPMLNCLGETAAIPLPATPETPDQLGQEKQARALAEVEQTFGTDVARVDDRIPERVALLGRLHIRTIDRIRAKLATVGARLVVIRPQTYAAPPLSPRVIAWVQSEIPEFAAPPPEVARETNLLMRDDAHLNLHGQQIYTRWLADTIRAGETRG